MLMFRISGERAGRIADEINLQSIDPVHGDRRLFNVLAGRGPPR